MPTGMFEVIIYLSKRDFGLLVWFTSHYLIDYVKMFWITCVERLCDNERKTILYVLIIMLW